jgi:hypothetical protein
MASFAVHRKDANRGTGIRPGRWWWEEFQFTDAIFGTATVEYRCEARKLTISEIADGDTSRPYQVEISEPRVVELKVFDDDGEEMDSLGFYNELERIVLDAFERIEDYVLDFERGLL